VIAWRGDTIARASRRSDYPELWMPERLLNAFSKKLENLRAAVALHFAYYNFGRVHRTLKVSPAMEAGIASPRLVNRGNR
jgi:hypothetical protein